MIDLRTFTYIDVLQPALASFLQTVAAGYQPLENQAALYVEVAPGMSVNVVTDIALKRTRVMPGFQIVERQYGMLELHHFDQGEVRAAGEAILSFYGLEEKQRLRPGIKSAEIITGIEGYQAMLINRMRHGDFLLEGQTLYIMEVHPAGYAAIACNEAEKAAPIHVLEMVAFGAFGRLYLGGYEAEIKEAAAAVEACLKGIEGRANA
jgi:ethanolamine utilization microcompartment shell protein EutS